MIERLLVANRGEIAVRVLRAAAELGIRTVAVYSEDDSAALHLRRATAAAALRGVGPAAYLDAGQLVAVAKEHGCDAVHPGYGFLSESAAFARDCAEAGLRFVGPRPETLASLGDKTRARALAAEAGVPVLPGLSHAVLLREAEEFFAGLGAGRALVVKAVAGGGGRGMRVVRAAEELAEAYARCQSEALQAFGDGGVYVEERMEGARHIEVQIAGDGSGAVVHLGERDCSLQRRHQKLVEVAPAPGLDEVLRDRLTADAVRLARAVGYESLGTFEFLVDAAGGYAFIEANARLQVEHTVTEAVLGIDLVQLQLRLAGEETLAQLGLTQKEVPAPRGWAVEARVNMETMAADGSVRPAGGVLAVFEPPSGPGVRVDTSGYAGYRPSASFDSLLAKVVAQVPRGSFAEAVRRLERALGEFRVEGVRTNIPFLRALLSHPAVIAGEAGTMFVEDHRAELLTAMAEDEAPPVLEAAPARARAGASVDAVDPLAVLDYGRGMGAGLPQPTPAVAAPVSVSSLVGPEGTVAVRAPMQGTVVSVDVREGQAVGEGGQLLVLNAMKMEHVIRAPAAGVVRQLVVGVGDTIFEGEPLVFVEERADVGATGPEADEVELEVVRPDLAEIEERHARTRDGARPEAVARRRKTGQRTARENVEDLCDAGSFMEYGPLVIAAQRRRRSLEDLIARTPADGMLAGMGRVNGELFGEERARCVVMSYDYTVLAGTQGQQNHRKKDRLFELAEKWRLPVVFFTEGGGGRPGDTDGLGIGFETPTFHRLGRLSGLVPLVGVNSGRCFAGNAAILGCCDVVIATADSNIGMAGPAMIEGGGLGVFRPEEVGPMAEQVPNGVVDVAVVAEAEAVPVAKQYLSYFQGSVAEWSCADQRLLRTLVPENRLRIYDVRRVIETLADAGSVLELRRHFGLGMVTALVRVEGRPLGVVANNPAHLAGAIDSPGADKAARFLQLCDAFDIPVLFLCDTPGMMVGPEVEKTALVRHCSRLFVVGANLSVPFFTIVLRKSYGLGALAMAGGGFRAGMFALSWPTGEFGGMGLEGSVKLGYRNELAAVADPLERKALFDRMVASAYDHAKALNAATHFEIDDVVDPAESRRWISTALGSVPPVAPRTGKKRPCVDTW
ncbi:MAG: carbamoyl-phosphate synthase large subunit [Dehalococcoidia bacterium]|nr:carbamoyl-phosphate synthase large subunit [Dehalococcoidia bacterium]